MDFRCRCFRRRRRRKTINTAAEARATTASGTEVDTAIVLVSGEVDFSLDPEVEVDVG